ncbi:MAG: hypothetical protein M3N53_14285 [Actinomycetota bacterium]|nr:hypothetical protein [Actinomycetota bacterium]
MNMLKSKGRIAGRPVLVGLVVMALLGGALSATARMTSNKAPRGFSGTFSLLAMVHTTEYNNEGLESEQPIPWDGTRRPGGPFVYASIPCNGNAPLNNISTDLTTYNTRLPGSRSPASTRNHPLKFHVVKNRDGKLRLRGRVVLTVCQLKPGVTPTPDPVPDAEKEKVYFRWNAKFKRTSPEEVRWIGKFRLTGGTGTYQDLTGEGDIAGYFFCFAAEGCATLGEFRDAQYTMSGTYHDPTIPQPEPSSSPS